MPAICFTCHQPGHTAPECPQRRRAWEPPRRDPEEQTRINEQGVALCRAALAQRGSTVNP